MQSIRKTIQLELPVHERSYDVVIAGGGPSGCAAATAAAREGARTLLIEATGVLGGMGTSGFVPCWTPYSDGKRIIYGGIAERVYRETNEGFKESAKFDDTQHMPFNPEQLKRVYDHLVTEAGVDVQFLTTVCHVERTDDGKVERLLLAHKAGLQTVKAACYVDTTGDAVVADLAGVNTRSVFQDGGEVMPSTLCFALTNVDEYAYRNGPYSWCGAEGSPVWDILNSGRHPEVESFHVTTNLIGPRAVGFNAGHLFNVDSTNPESVSKALIKGRRMAEAIRKALSEFAPEAFGNANLILTGNLLGVRESRRIHGDYTLTGEDYFARRSFDDEIGRNSYYVDTHPGQNEQADIRTHNDFMTFIHKMKSGGNDENRPYDRSIGESHGIPYRCLIPKGCRNLLVAGRSISCDRVALSSIRVMCSAMVMGEAAGTAAAMTAAGKLEDVRQVDTDLLRQKLKKQKKCPICKTNLKKLK